MPGDVDYGHYYSLILRHQHKCLIVNATVSHVQFLIVLAAFGNNLSLKHLLCRLYILSSSLKNSCPKGFVPFAEALLLVECRGRNMRHSDYRLYADSKLKLFMFTAELQRRLHAAGSSTDVFSVHPGQSGLHIGVLQ